MQPSNLSWCPAASSPRPLLCAYKPLFIVPVCSLFIHSQRCCRLMTALDGSRVCWIRCCHVRLLPLLLMLQQDKLHGRFAGCRGKNKYTKSGCHKTMRRFSPPLLLIFPSYHCCCCSSCLPVCTCVYVSVCVCVCLALRKINHSVVVPSPHPPLHVLLSGSAVTSSQTNCGGSLENWLNE